MLKEALEIVERDLNDPEGRFQKSTKELEETQREFERIRAMPETTKDELWEKDKLLRELCDREVIEERQDYTGLKNWPRNLASRAEEHTEPIRTILERVENLRKGRMDLYGKIVTAFRRTTEKRHAVSDSKS